MKKLLLVFGLLSAINVAIFSQEEADRKFTIQTSPGLYLIDLLVLGAKDDAYSYFIMDLEGQYKINESMNVSLTLSFSVTNNIIHESGTNMVYSGTNAYGLPIYYPEYYSYSYKENIFQMTFKPMFIYRPFKTGLEGFYIGLYPNIGWQTLKNKDEDSLWIEVGAGINTGYKWVFNSGFTLQLGAGIGKTWSIPKKPDDDIIILNPDGWLTLKNFDIHIVDFKLGYSF